jgi:HAD superfamily hydrolase (TIGR01509 family)
VAFDLDGLMINTEEIFNEVGREMLRRRGMTMTDEILCAMMGRRAPEAFAALIERTGLNEPIPALIAESAVMFEAIMEDRLRPMPGLHSLLDRIAAAGIPSAVATSSGRRYLDGMLQRFELSHRFVTTLAAEDVTHGKPHPEIYLKAADRLSVAPREMLVLEDSHTGTTAAVSAGTVAVSIPHPLSRSQDFTHAYLVATRLDDPAILDLFE